MTHARWKTEKDVKTPIPRIYLSGSAFERGEKYGREAKDRVLLSRAEYAKVYAHFAKWDWDRATTFAHDFIKPIEEFDKRWMDEIRGIAKGAELDVLDVLAMNLRTEILFAAKAGNTDAELPRIAECTAFSALTESGERIAGQNWDWLTFSTETVVMLEVEPEDGPSFMTVVEAGLLAKFGMNAAGIVTNTNALVSSADIGSPGVPYHVMLRALLDCTTPTEWAEKVQSAERSSSANYMLTTADGLAIDAETLPGDDSRIAWEEPDENGFLTHANHCSVPREWAVLDGIRDLGRSLMADSMFRIQQARMLGRSLTGKNSTVQAWKDALQNHAGYPDSLCCHPQDGAHSQEAWQTVVGAVFEPASLRAHISFGTPCNTDWMTFSYR